MITGRAGPGGGARARAVSTTRRIAATTRSGSSRWRECPLHAARQSTPSRLPVASCLCNSCQITSSAAIGQAGGKSAASGAMPRASATLLIADVIVQHESEAAKDMASGGGVEVASSIQRQGISQYLVYGIIRVVHAHRTEPSTTRDALWLAMEHLSFSIRFRHVIVFAVDGETRTASCRIVLPAAFQNLVKVANRRYPATNAAVAPNIAIAAASNITVPAVARAIGSALVPDTTRLGLTTPS